MIETSYKKQGTHIIIQDSGDVIVIRIKQKWILTRHECEDS